MKTERQQLILLIQEARKNGSRLKPACNEAMITMRTYKRWKNADGVKEDKRPITTRKNPGNKLSTEEVAAILTKCNEPEYSNLPPSQIVPRLADEGVYLGSESTFYRILKANNQLTHRGYSKVAAVKKPCSTHNATAPKQVFSWDITYLASKIKGQFFYLYLFEDIFSRKIVGYEVYEEESGEYAAVLLQRIIMKEQCFHKPLPLVLHSDNGAPMKSFTFKAKMEEMGVISSYSRPRVSNDNPYSESLFRTLKYCPIYPCKGFESLEKARGWVESFVDWYNNEHRHSKIGFVTPEQKHLGKDAMIMEKRKAIYEAAKKKNPQRWSGNIRDWQPVNVVTLNPEKIENQEVKDKQFIA